MNIKFTLNPDASLPITCPKCGNQQEHLLSRLRANPELECAGCGTIFRVNANEIDAVVKLFEKFKG